MNKLREESKAGKEIKQTKVRKVKEKKNLPARFSGEDATWPRFAGLSEALAFPNSN